MKTLVISIISVFTIAVFSACEKEKSFEDVLCYEFDQRQCAGDEWAELIPITDSESERVAKMKTYLETKNIRVKEVQLQIDYYPFVCEACNVCPELDRFYVQFDQEDLSEFEQLDLLNFAEMTCSDRF